MLVGLWNSSRSKPTRQFFPAFSLILIPTDKVDEFAARMLPAIDARSAEAMLVRFGLRWQIAVINEYQSNSKQLIFQRWWCWEDQIRCNINKRKF